MKLTVSLNGNYLCPFQLFIDINSQLSKPLTDINSEAFAPICELDSINDWINLESFGKPSTLKAQALCDKVSESLKQLDDQNIELHIHVDEGVLTSDNLYSLLFLPQSTPSLTLWFYVKPEKKEQLTTTIAALLDNETIIVHFKDANFSENPQIELVANRNKLLEKIGFNVDSQGAPDIFKLIGFAWICLKSGAYDIGTQVLTNALDNSDLPEAIRETVFMQLQLIRFLSHQYEAVALAEFPDFFHFLKPEDATSLHFIKAYAATLTRHLDIAAIHFKQCRVDENLALTNENSLYRLNLFALFLALQNKDETAMTLELRIKDHIQEHDINVVGLKYVNFINIARLYKKAKQYDNALKYYTWAYQEISGGGYTPSDHIYCNMNLGSLHEAAGNVETALFFWIKAAIHWLSFENKYALSWRPRLILCQEKITDVLKPLSIDKANQFLYDKINGLIALCGIPLIEYASSRLLSGGQQPLIRPAGTFSPGLWGRENGGGDLSSVDTCYAANNMVIYGATTSTQLMLQGTSAKLNDLVVQLLKQTMNIQDVHNILAIDVHNEFAPSSAEQCWIFSILAGCKNTYYNRQAIDYDQAQTQRLLNQTTICLARSITSITPTPSGLQLIYNRSFLNKTIAAPDEVKFINLLQQEKQVNVKVLDTNMRVVLARLIEQRVVMIHYPALEFVEEMA